MKKRVNISISAQIQNKARILMKLRDFEEFSTYLEDLIRTEWERRNGPLRVADLEAAPKSKGPPEVSAVGPQKAEAHR